MNGIIFDGDEQRMKPVIVFLVALLAISTIMTAGCGQNQKTKTPANKAVFILCYNTATGVDIWGRFITKLNP
jgi:hypothetical protein